MKAEEFSDFKCFSGCLESPLWLWSPRFHGLIKCWKSSGEGRVKRLGLKCAPKPLHWPGTRRARSLKWGIRGQMHHSAVVAEQKHPVFKGISRRALAKFHFKTLQQPSNGCKLRNTVKVCLFLSITDRPDPVFSKLFMKVFWAAFAKHENGLIFLPSFFFPLCSVCLLTTAVIWDYAPSPASLNLEEGQWKMKGVYILLSRTNPGRRQYLRRREMWVFKNIFLPTVKAWCQSFTSCETLNHSLNFCRASGVWLLFIKDGLRFTITRLRLVLD